MASSKIIEKKKGAGPKAGSKRRSVQSGRPRRVQVVAPPVVHQLTVPCPSCGGQVRANARFCTKCGSSLTGPMPQIEPALQPVEQPRPPEFAPEPTPVDPRPLPKPLSSMLRSPDRSNVKRLVVALLVLVVVASGFAFALTSPDDPGFELASFRGKSGDVAQAALASKGLVIKTAEAPSTEGVEGGAVVRTEPPAGTNVEHGDTVTIFVTPKRRAPEKIVVPKLVGKTLTQAKAMLHVLGLGAKTTFVENTPHDPGTVLSTAPGAGTRVHKKGTTIKLKVAKQKKVKAVPGPQPTPEPKRKEPAAQVTPTPKPKPVEVTKTPEPRPVNKAPVASDQIRNLNGDHQFWTIWLRAGDVTDPEGDAWAVYNEQIRANYGTVKAISCEQDPAHGCFKYTPNYSGSYRDAFYYRVWDSQGNVSKRAIITVNVRCGC